MSAYGRPYGRVDGEVRGELQSDAARDGGAPRAADPGLTDDPAALAEAARLHLRQKFLDAEVAISGANFAIAETGTLGVVESEGNGRMCLTLPRVLITVMGLEKVVPTWQDLEVFLQLLPRASTGERMNPYTSMWTGVTPGDGPQNFHLVLLDNGRSAVLADEVGRQALHCIRCSACLNVCPVYERAGGHAYGSPYPGPIGAILSPQLRGVDSPIDASLPFASSLCGACYEVCPVAINIPEALVHLRAKVVDAKREKAISAERVAFSLSGRVLRSPRLLAAAQDGGFTAPDTLLGDPWLAPLRADAAAAFNDMSRAYAEQHGFPLCVTDSYRNHAEQVAVRAAKPTLAAVPGTSNHGWGVALDLCGGAERYDTPLHRWLVDNAAAYGWFLPAWAQAGGSKPEPWHWEFAG